MNGPIYALKSKLAFGQLATTASWPLASLLVSRSEGPLYPKSRAFGPWLFGTRWPSASSKQIKKKREVQYLAFGQILLA